MSPITTHVLDTSLGKPATGVAVILYRMESGGATEIGRGVTDSDGRVTDLLSGGAPIEGGYLLSFDTGGYFESHGVEAFYPSVEVRFRVTQGGGHYHVPLLLSPFGYSTYRGS